MKEIETRKKKNDGIHSPAPCDSHVFPHTPRTKLSQHKQEEKGTHYRRASWAKEPGAFQKTTLTHTYIHRDLHHTCLYSFLFFFF